jgi:DNA helicase-2/ATP-dependent DNA helicase PcrA
MYRTTAQSRVLEQAFRVSDIPYRIVGGVRFYDRKEVKDVLAVFRLLHNPADAVSLDRVLDNFPIGRGIGPKALDGLRTWADLRGLPTIEALVALAPTVGQPVDAPPLAGAARSAAQRVGIAIARLRERIGKVPLTELFDQVVEDTRYADAFDRDVEEEMQRWANVLELRSDLAKFDLLDPEDALATYLEQVSLISDVDTMEDDSRGRVTLITLHSAKGLEFPIVFITGVEDGLLPISRAIEVSWSDPMPLEEERRLFYVGITRAKDLLFITHAARRLAYGSFQPGMPSRFLASLLDNAATISRGSLRGVGRLSDRVRDVSPRDGARAPGDSRSMGQRPPAVELPDFVVGQLIFHPHFGEGRIVEVVSKSDDQELVIDFKSEKHGRKRLMASLARLDVIE